MSGQERHDVADYHPDVVLGDPRAGGKAEAAGEEVFAHTVDIGRGRGVDRLQVHWFPEQACLDAERVEVETYAVGGEAAGEVGVNRDCREPEVGVGMAVGVAVKVNAGYGSEELGIEGRETSVMGYVLFEDGHLAASYAGADVAHAVVVADVLVLIVGIWLAGLCCVEHRSAARVVVGTYECASARGGDHLVAVEAEYAVETEGAALVAAIGRAESFGGVLDHWDVIASGYVEDAVHVGRHAVEVYGDDGGGLASGHRDAVVDGALEQGGVHIPGRRLGVDKYRSRSDVCHGVGRCGESEALAYHLVAGLYAGEYQAQVYGCGAGRDGGHAQVGARRVVVREEVVEFVLEGVDIGAEGHYPIVGEGFVDIFLLVAAHVGEAEMYALWCVHDCTGCIGLVEGRSVCMIILRSPIKERLSRYSRLMRTLSGKITESL